MNGKPLQIQIFRREPRSGLTRLLVCAAAVLLVAAWVPPLTYAQGQSTASSAGYRVGPKDLLDIKVFEVPELNIERRVSEDGTINLPLIGEFPVSALTVTEVANRLKALLEAKYVQRASVSVQVKEFRSKPIAVLGAVRQPGNLAFSGRWTLLEAISAAGGLADTHGDTIHVLRRADNGLTDQISIAVDDLILRADPNANIPIFANDVVNVMAKIDVTVFCVGEVKTPGAQSFQSTDRITVLTAIARAGGLTDRASKKIQIKRRERDGRETEFEVDYRRILSGKDADLALQGGDVLVVKESFL
jgi:polysaccharide export outer membrane protein